MHLRNIAPPRALLLTLFTLLVVSGTAAAQGDVVGFGDSGFVAIVEQEDGKLGGAYWFPDESLTIVPPTLQWLPPYTPPAPDPRLMPQCFEEVAKIQQEFQQVLLGQALVAEFQQTGGFYGNKSVPVRSADYYRIIGIMQEINEVNWRDYEQALTDAANKCP